MAQNPPETIDPDDLWEIFDTCIVWALNDFLARYGDIEFKKKTKIEQRRIDTEASFANVTQRISDNEDRLRINVSDGLVARLSSDVVPGDENSMSILQWRVHWLVHHELAHWLFGHISFYRTVGWTAHLGITDGDVTDTPQSLDFNDQDYQLAHAAELAADTWAIRELFAEIRSTPAEDDTEEPFLDILNRDTQLCYYTILSTVSQFYAGRGGASAGKMHPEWDLRSLSMVVTLYQSYMQEIFGAERIRPGKVLANELIASHAIGFMQDALGPAIESLDAFSEQLGFDTPLHARPGEGFFDPSEFVHVIRLNKRAEGRAAELIEMYKAYDRLADLTSEMLAGRNMVTNYIYGEHRMSDQSDTFDHSLLSEFDAETSRIIADSWAAEYNLKIEEFETSDGPGIEDGGILIDLMVSMAGALGVEGMLAAIKVLKNRLKKSDVDS